MVASHVGEDRTLLAQALSEQSGRRVQLVKDVRGQRARWLSLALENAALSLQAYLADRRNMFARFVDLQEALQLETMPERLECFDISHTMGEGNRGQLCCV